MRKIPTPLEGMYLLDTKPTGGGATRPLPYPLVIHNNFSNRMALRRRWFIQISALSTFDGNVVDYHGRNG
jgi:hypothetical protein